MLKSGDTVAFPIGMRIRTGPRSAGDKDHNMATALPATQQGREATLKQVEILGKTNPL